MVVVLAGPMVPQVDQNGAADVLIGSCPTAGRASGPQLEMRDAQGGAVSLAGKWRITQRDLWGHEAIDLVGPAFTGFGHGRSGSFRFIAADAWMDCRHEERNGRPYVEFTWDGNDDCDPATGADGRSSRRMAP